MMDWKDIPIIDGTGQQDRFFPALAKDYFNVDELSFEALLAMAARFASEITFYNLNNEADGNWGELFEANEAVIMAKILSTDLNRIESEFLAISYLDLGKRIDFLLNLVLDINRWFTRLNVCRHKSGEALARNMAALIDEKLAIELHNLGLIIDQAETASQQLDFSKFTVAWDLGDQGSSNPFPRSTIGDPNDLENIKQQLNNSFHVFSNAVRYLQEATGPLIKQSLNSGRHNPATGLFMVFLKLYEKAQKGINRFTPRHLDFYYEKILKVKHQDAIPESYYLLLETQAGTDKVCIKKNTEFSAGKDEELNEIIYRADEGLIVRDARVAALATLYLDHDRLISPESELGYATRSKVGKPSADINADPEQNEQHSWTLFGASQSEYAKMGFSIASPLLLLEQGKRKIEIAIEFNAITKSEIDDQILALCKCKTEQGFRQRFSSLFAQYLLSFKGCLTIYQKTEIIRAAETLLSGNSANEISKLLNDDWQGLFYRLFKQIFNIKLSTENGWSDVPDYILMPYSSDAESNKIGFKLFVNLGQEAKPVTPYNAEVHGGQFDTELPLMHCVINPQANFYPYSLFQNLAIASLKIDVDVRDVKNILAYNQHGQLDTTKPFQPFGPLPTRSSYLVFGNYELARKRITELSIKLDWAELPHDAGGFDEYYTGYETGFSNDGFRVAFKTLSDGRWLPDDAAARRSLKLFETDAAGSQLVPGKTISIKDIDFAKPVEADLYESKFLYDHSATNGFFRLSLTEPEQAFGHVEYSQLLPRVLSAKVSRKKPQTVLNPPYTPGLNNISLDYKASATIRPGQHGDKNNNKSEKLIHLHPFGVETVYPTAIVKSCFLMPQYKYAGNLFIGISAKELCGRLTLLFHLSRQEALETPRESACSDWFYLASNSWEKISKEMILSDTTNGFQSPGVVTLDIPTKIKLGNTVMPDGNYWLRVSTNQVANTDITCHSIKPNALKVSKKSDANSKPITAIKWTSVHPQIGIGNIDQAYNSFGGRSQESDRARKIRIGERLRHKNRALLPWDYEHLILEKFPEIHKVKCFNSITSTDDVIKPGHVLVVVVRDVEQDTTNSCLSAMADAPLLENIKTYVDKRSSCFTNIEVRNPQYERVQVRCKVQFVDSISEGDDIKRLNQAISDYISPWQREQGYKTRFGWVIKQQDIESYIRSLDYVKFVTDFSMLHITKDRDGNYRLFDTAKGENNHQAEIRPHYRWSLALPMEKHFIETIQVAKSIKAEITGVDELAVGSTFIISGSG